MRGFICIIFSVLLVGCSSPISFTTDDGPTWVRQLDSTLEEDRNDKIRAPGKGKGKGTTPVRTGTVHDAVAPLPVPVLPASQIPEKPEWVAELEKKVAEPRVGKQSRQQVTIRDDLVGADETPLEPPPVVAEPPKPEPPKNNKLDIVVVVDSSNSMDHFLRRVPKTFRGFIPTLAPLDWQIMFTNADHGDHGFFLANWTSRDGTAMSLERDGRLLLGEHYLTKKTEDYRTVFLDTLRLHTAYEYMDHRGDVEKTKCELSPGCQGWNEQPLKAMQASFVKNRSFFRPGANVAVILFSDGDEGEDLKPEKRVKAQEVLKAFQEQWGVDDKQLKTYGIVMIPGEDEECRQKYSSGFWGGEGVFGTELVRMADLTGGRNLSICSDNYQSIAQQIVSDFL